MKKIYIISMSVIIFLAILGFFFTPYDPEAMDVTLKNAAPSITHWFGNDTFGRDVLSRTMAGMSSTFLIALTIVILGGISGIAIGAVTGYFGGWLDEIIMRINDTLTAFPSILLGLIVVALTGSGAWNVILALQIMFIPSFARVARAEILKQKSLDYVKNAKNMGAGSARIIVRHILPNTMSVILPSFAIAFNNAVLAEAGMSFLGLGVQPPQASLGRMMSEASGYLSVAPWGAIAPGMVMVMMILIVGMVAEKMK